MKTLLAAAILSLTTLYVLTNLVDFPGEGERAELYFSPRVVQIGREYAAQGQWITWGARAVHFAFLVSLVYLGFGRRLADWADRLTGGRWLLSLVTVVAACFLIDQLLKTPFRVASLRLSFQYDMSTTTWQAWAEDLAKTLALNGLLQIGIFVGLFALIYFLPRTWWIAAGFLSVALACLFALVLPVWVNPLFNEFRPLKDPTLEKNVLDLAGRAGVSVREVLVMDASRRTRHTNAYFTGFGSTRRIVVFDTLLRQPAADLSSSLALAGSPWGQGPLLAASTMAATRAMGDAEVSSVFAHEIGHWLHDHIVKGIALGGIGAFAGLWLLSLFLRGNVGKPPLRLRSLTDPAAVPLILFLFSLGNWLVMPLENAVGREFERQADRTALDLTRDPDSFIAAEKSLAIRNKGNVAPNPIAQWYFSTHPSAVERIEAAERWRRIHVGER
jgi:STE24 endopeptidase